MRVEIKVKKCQLQVEIAHSTVQGSTLRNLARIYLDIYKEHGDMEGQKL